MPQNAFYKPWDNYEKIFKKWNKRVKKIRTQIKMQIKGMPLKDKVFYLILYPIHKLIKRLYRKSFPDFSGSPSNLPIEELIHLIDRSLTSNEKCTGCRVCVKICPVKNIEIMEKKPVWQNGCENCLACYNFCPNKAIETGIVAKGYYYRHLDIKMKDIMQQSTY
ncbi:MAG: hypothetical protein BAJALOKI1v1_180021 [Promethearchaeota archaeon]|nr:MAG: hypothetical protein BAJALOKI1v1_180021 [Candidatus Lokiarchaeota archaeon]